LRTPPLLSLYCFPLRVYLLHNLQCVILQYNYANFYFTTYFNQSNILMNDFPLPRMPTDGKLNLPKIGACILFPGELRMKYGPRSILYCFNYVIILTCSVGNAYFSTKRSKLGCNSQKLMGDDLISLNNGIPETHIKLMLINIMQLHKHTAIIGNSKVNLIIINGKS
jgi:hypothetical protein